jgi:hypothetical protein
VLVWLGTTATAACADAERTRGVAWLEPRLQAEITWLAHLSLAKDAPDARMSPPRTHAWLLIRFGNAGST